VVALLKSNAFGSQLLLIVLGNGAEVTQKHVETERLAQDGGSDTGFAASENY
jgi:hypothetical protein